MKEKEYFIRLVLDYGISISAKDKDEAYEKVCEIYKNDHNIYLDADEFVEIVEESAKE